jgi:hypothetical protein
MRPLLAALLLLCPPALTGAALPGEPVRAVRLAEPLHVDGRLDEPAWAAAPSFDGFLQLFPDEGRPPSERTEVRVLFDDRTLYVGISCHDSRPDEVSRPLGRRDNAPYSDQVSIYLDSMHDRRTAYVFSLNAAGVQADKLLYGDDQESTDWDAVWDGAVAETPDGWSAEFAIPLSILRFSPADQQVWGFGVMRVLARTHEELVSIRLKRADRGVVAHFAELTGLDGLAPVQELSLTPYLATRLILRPKYDDGTADQPRLLDPTAELGLDLRASLGRGLALQGAINPDFGQVEADQVTLNLSRYELFFPEKRPFFMQGLELFQGPTPHNQPSPQQLFYSRRVGLDAPILAATKLTGRATDELQVGLVESVVTGAGRPAGFDVANPTRSYRFSAGQPLFFGPVDALPSLAPASRNLLAGVARWQPDSRLSLGATVTSALPLGPTCTDLEADTSANDPAPLSARPRRCDVLTGHALAVDWNLRSADGEWFLRGQLSGSQYLGGGFTEQAVDPGSLAAPRRHRILTDGTVLHPGDLGWGGLVAFGRNGGEPWRFDVDVEYESRRLELNAVGYQRTQNELRLRPVIRYVRPTGGGAWNEYAVALGTDARLSADGRFLTGATSFLAFEAQHKSFHVGGCELDFDASGYDRREIERSGLAFQRVGSWNFNCWVSSDRARAVVWNADAGYGQSTPLAGVRQIAFWWADAGAVVKLGARVQSEVQLHYELDQWPARWVGLERSTQRQWFAELLAPSFSVILRQQLLLTPGLTFQAYLQLYVDAGRYGPYYWARPADGRVRSADLVPGSPAGSLDVPDFGSIGNFHDATLNVNAVVRWEYRLGSTLYFVYTRGATLADWIGPAPFTLQPRNLAHGPTTDSVLVKWSWYWAA